MSFPLGSKIISKNVDSTFVMQMMLKEKTQFENQFEDQNQKDSKIYF